MADAPAPSRPGAGCAVPLAAAVDDVCYSVLTCDDGATVNLGISYALPEKYPAMGHAAGVEVLGTDGMMILDDDHLSDHVSNKGVVARRRSPI